MENNKNEKEISLAQLFEVFKKSLIVMIIAAILCAALAAAYSVFIDKPEYKGTATFWVNSTSSNYDYASSSQTAAAASIATSCLELAKQDLPVRRAVQEYGLVEKLGFKDENDCVKAIRSMITATKNDDNSMVFYLSVTASSQQATYDIVTAIQSVMPGVLQGLLGLEVNENNAPILSVVGPVSNAEQIVEVKSSPIKLGILGAVLAAIVVYAIYFILSIFDTSIVDDTIIKEQISSPIVGSIPSWNVSGESSRVKTVKPNKKGPDIAVRNYEEKLLSDSSPFYVTEAFNTLRTNVIYSATAAKNPIFAVTSDIAGVGKTVVASNLAIALSGLDKKVLLVECDMRCPTFSKIFKSKVETGLSELLADMVSDTAKVAKRYNDTSLDILFCGKIPPNPSELLSSARMAELAEEWKKTYDYIILDMPPIGEVYDAGVVANIVNGYVLTVRCNYSNINDVKGAKDKIEQVGGSLLGIILNDLNPKSGKKYGKYYSYGSYGKKAE